MHMSVENVLTNLKDTRLSKFEAKKKKRHDKKKHGKKKKHQQEKFQPSKGVAQLPRSWSEASTIASDKKRAKELYQVRESNWMIASANTCVL